ncbi:MAG TPA: TetR/AcrR family transcriptional regulator [Kouleothrix sp.]|uniref:TetR/AcrR family transcriptional regulator n=1 Tax=Kouleothrix sp. TaxID=2779161 RepID=UPI002CB82E92|nr:TetR/AcrR family transcriptional regulator [Kouleothrix sp.]HRC74661.1 TetR/AcrR family transcriptional regulator [Kouleothrix sp.]
MPKVSEAHSAARRQQIIDAAYRCFARKGFHQASMRDIYEEAQLSPGAVYHYFPSKDAIIQASFEFDYQRSLDLFAAATASDDPLKALRELITFFFRGLEGAAELGAGRVNVQSWGEALVNPPLRETLQRVMAHYLAALTEIIRRAQAGGQLDPALDPQAFGRILLSLYYGFELQKALDPAVEVPAYAAAVQALIMAVTCSEPSAR